MGGLVIALCAGSLCWCSAGLRVGQDESDANQTALVREIAAHRRTDAGACGQAAIRAKEFPSRSTSETG